MSKQFDSIKRSLDEQRAVETEFAKQVIQEKRNFIETVRGYLKAEKYTSKDAQAKKDFLLTKECLTVIQALSKKNFTLVEISSVFGLTQREFAELKNEFGEVDDALANGFAERDTEVEDAMHKMAVGFFVEEETNTTKSRGESQPVIEKRINKRFIPPSPFAGQYLMNNRRSYEYKKDTNDNVVPDANKFDVNFVFFESDKKDEKE